MGVVYRISVDDRQIQSALDRLITVGQSPREVMRDIATYGENSTRDRFKTGTDPDGNAWKPSLRVQEKGGKTLIDSNRLLSSITSQSGNDFAEWGTNVIYAAIHQVGGEIRPKAAKSLFFKVADGTARRVKKVTIPARPFLGINAEDEENILDIVNQHLADAVNG
ncbi:MAG: phage virion morphogenesis protein [Nitrosomonas sp. PRO4]|nr:phage virion morphogenesis protein [Nitrosomonas sp. PRO4]